MLASVPTNSQRKNAKKFNLQEAALEIEAIFRFRFNALCFLYPLQLLLHPYLYPTSTPPPYPSTLLLPYPYSPTLTLLPLFLHPPPLTKAGICKSIKINADRPPFSTNKIQPIPQLKADNLIYSLIEKMPPPEAKFMCIKTGTQE